MARITLILNVDSWYFLAGVHGYWSCRTESRRRIVGRSIFIILRDHRTGVIVLSTRSHQVRARRHIPNSVYTTVIGRALESEGILLFEAPERFSIRSFYLLKSDTHMNNRISIDVRYPARNHPAFFYVKHDIITGHVNFAIV